MKGTRIPWLQGFGVRRPWGACWMVSVTERVKTLFFSPLQPGRGGPGGGGVGGVSRARFPPGPHLRGNRFSRFPPLRLPPTRRLFQNDKWLFWLALLGARAQKPGRKALEAPAPRPQALGPKPLRTRAPGPVTLIGFVSRNVSACCTIDFLSPGHPRPACWA